MKQGTFQLKDEWDQLKEKRISLVEAGMDSAEAIIISVKPVAQRQEMVSGTLALLTGLLRVAICVSRASAPKGDEVL